MSNIPLPPVGSIISLYNALNSIMENRVNGNKTDDTEKAILDAYKNSDLAKELDNLYNIEYNFSKTIANMDVSNKKYVIDLLTLVSVLLSNIKSTIITSEE
jgi:hypothetical protein